eukprot:gene17473-56565_t
MRRWSNAQYPPAVRRHCPVLNAGSPYFKAVMCYSEGAWTNMQEDIAEPFASERHHIDADTWKELNEKTSYLFM